MFKKILIANRGEIAVRIIRACKELNIPTVAVHSDVDSESMHVRLADESICIGSHKPQNSYLNIAAIISAADITGADAIHPGYGFLSENYRFAEIVTKNKIKFIGPSSEIMKKMGDKIEAKKTVKKLGLPIIEGSEGNVNSFSEAKKIALTIGYPILIKASAGGGGKGMKLVNNELELENSLIIAKQEAKKYFSNDEVYIEKFFKNPRHIEVQILSDKTTTIHLGERDCSVQRKHQKLIEESPSPVLKKSTRDDLLKKTVEMVSKLDYEGAGTVEFIYDNGKFFFLEMNTRIQVEHPVTEMVTGADLIKWQILTHAGQKFPDYLNNMKLRGHSIECRINAEDPDMNFAPSPMKITSFHMPGGKGVRIDSHAYAGYEIPSNYDSLIGKLIVHSPNRESAINRMERALEETIIEGPKTTIPFHQQIMKDKKFRSGEFDTSFLETFDYKKEGKE